MDTKRLHSDSFSGEFHSQKKKSCRVTRLNIVVGVVLTVGLLLTTLNVYELQQMREEHMLHRDDHPITIVEGGMERSPRNGPVVWILGKHLDTGYLTHVKVVFERLGFYVTNGEDDWDVLWAHDYPFVTMKHIMTQLHPHQRVNHFPGSGFITNKGSLATMQLEAFPRCFRVPKDKDKLFEYAASHPETMWVQKNNNHRGIRIKQLDELDFESEGSFVQEFVAKPLLIDKRKFDIGVYAILTSLNPLRVYIVNDEALFRFCPEEYYPFDKNNVNKYVVHDSYMPMWKMPSLKTLYTDQKYSFKESFNRHMINAGYNVTKMWSDIHETIRAVYLKKQPIMLQAGSKYKTTRNFFELVRFDFVLDEVMKLYLMEVNMSPNLSTNHFKGNKRLYQHVMYNVLRVSRVASLVNNHFHNSDNDAEEMLASDKEIMVFSEWCSTSECQGKSQCSIMKCRLCSHCLEPSLRTTLKDAFLENYNKGGTIRIFPPTINRSTALKWSPKNDAFNLPSHTAKNRAMYMWFIGMCRKDQSFC